MNKENKKNTPSKEQGSGKVGRKRKSGRFLLLLFYIAFCASFPLAIVPLGATNVFMLMGCILILSMIYTFRVRGKKSGNELVVAHTTYIIHSFWRSTALLIITSFIGLLYMLVQVDYHPLETCAAAVFGLMRIGKLNALCSVLETCGDLIVEENIMHLKIVGFIAFSPVFLYVLWRCAKGSVLLAFGRT